jgi:hypothetical protein
MNQSTKLSEPNRRVRVTVSSGCRPPCRARGGLGRQLRSYPRAAHARLSDELAPIDLHSLVVHPFAHALCLKEPVLERLRLPGDMVRVGKRFHVASGLFHPPRLMQPLPLGAFIFLGRSGHPRTSERIGTAAGAAHLLSNTLKGRCHEGDGLPAAVRLAQRVPCFTLDVSDLVAACREVRAILDAAAAMTP